MRSEQPLSQTLLNKGLDNIAVNVKRILEISRRLVRFSRVGDDPRTGFAVDDAMREALLGVRQQGALGAIEVRHQGDTGSMVYGNRGQVQQIFVNLFSNAAQAMAGEGVLQVEQRRIGNYIEVLVIDSGPGVAPESAGRIFEPFFTTKSSTHGTGLGLSVSAEIAREHGGSIELRRNGADGATFCVALPAYRP
jgi:C4-dicarboxylate-specific signal transduction histidine kinase